jgi:DNA-binding transcriptional LysR family regulator
MIFDHLRRTDLNLLVILHVLLDERNVTRAADRLLLTQPAVSRALQRLRLLLDDPLLVRTGRSMLPTDTAMRLIAPLEALLGRVDRLIEAKSFDPSLAVRQFSIAATDAATESVMMRVIRHVAPRAPGLSFRITHMGPDALARNAAGEIDFAIDVFAAIPPPHRSHDLFLDHFVCQMRSDHPLASVPLDRAAYESARHVRLTGTGGNPEELEETFLREGLTRKIAVELPSFLAAQLLVAQSDYLLTIPSGPAERAGRILPLIVRPLPFESRAIPLNLVWHRRSDEDAGHAWLRNQILDLFSPDREAAHTPK